MIFSKLLSRFTLALTLTLIVAGGFFVVRQQAAAQEAKPDLEIVDIIHRGDASIPDLLRNFATIVVRNNGTVSVTTPIAYDIKDLQNGKSAPRQSYTFDTSHPLRAGENIYIDTQELQYFSDSGSYHFQATIDPVGGVDESNEANNTFSKSVSVSVPNARPDLVVSEFFNDISILPLSFSVGDRISSVHFTVRNQGTRDSGRYQYLVEVWDAGGKWVCMLNNISQGLPIGQSSTHILNNENIGVINNYCPPFTQTGTYTLRGTVETLDYTDSNKNNNNVSMAFQVRERGLSDLTITDVTLVPSNPQVGESVTVKVSVKNLGGPFTSGQGIDNWYASIQDLTWTSGGPALGPSRQVTAASPMLTGETILYTGSGKFTSTGVKSTYFRVDNSNELAELNEDNNSWSKSITIGNAVPMALKPDLVVEKITLDPAVPLANQPFRVTAWVKNIGTAEAFIPNSSPRTGPTANINVDNGTYIEGVRGREEPLSPGAMAAYIFGSITPLRLSDAGSFSIQVTVDRDGVITESNEGNNSLTLSAESVSGSGVISGNKQTTSGRLAKISWQTDGRYNCSIVFKGHSDISDDLLFPGAGMSIAYAGERTSLDVDLNSLSLPNRESDRVVYYKIVCRDRTDGHKVTESTVYKIELPAASAVRPPVSSTVTPIENDPDAGGNEEVRSLRERIKRLELRISDLEKQVVERERQLTARINEVLTKRVAGNILLQVQGNGEAWYVDPITEQRFYLRDGQGAYQALQAFGLGIKTFDLSKIPIGIEKRFQDVDSDGDGLFDKLEQSLGTNPNDRDSDKDGFSDGEEIHNGYDPRGNGRLIYDSKLSQRLNGRILIDVDGMGRAWYVKGGKRYYLKDGDSAYQIMRFLSLGITNENLRKIAVGEFE